MIQLIGVALILLYMTYITWSLASVTSKADAMTALASQKIEVMLTARRHAQQAEARIDQLERQLASKHLMSATNTACIDCGEPIKASARFCPHCGKSSPRRGLGTERARRDDDFTQDQAEVNRAVGRILAGAKREQRQYAEQIYDGSGNLIGHEIRDR